MKKSAVCLPDKSKIAFSYNSFPSSTQLFLLLLYFIGCNIERSVSREKMHLKHFIFTSWFPWYTLNIQSSALVVMTNPFTKLVHNLYIQFLFSVCLDKNWALEFGPQMVQNAQEERWPKGPLFASYVWNLHTDNKYSLLIRIQKWTIY